MGTLPPIVRPKGIDDVPVLAVTLWGREGTSGVDLERVAHAMESELKRGPGTREVQTIGGPGRTVQVTLQPERLRERGVDVLRLKQTLAAANQAMPAGNVIDAAGSGPTRSAWVRVMRLSGAVPRASSVRMMALPTMPR